MNWIAFFFVIHIIVCTVVLSLRILRIIKCGYINIFIAYFVPVWGMVMLVRKRYSDRHSEREGDTIDAQRPTAELEKKSIPIDTEEKDIVPLAEALAVNDSVTRRDIMMDSLYSVNKSIVVENDELKEKVVPLEEALVVNDTATRRNLIIDVLYSNPSEYVAQLNDAKENKDTEVVHYAATALAEIQKDFDLKFHDIMMKKAQKPDDEATDNEYQILLENYIASGLLEGDALRGQLRNYSQLLKKKIARKDIKGRWTLLNKKADADVRLRDAAELDKDIALMAKRWPEHENVYLYMLQSAMLRRDSAHIRRIIKEIRDKNIYLSAELRGLVQFWEEKAG